LSVSVCPGVAFQPAHSIVSLKSLTAASVSIQKLYDIPKVCQEVNISLALLEPLMVLTLNLNSFLTVP
jgi:hypothetical protein